MASNSFYEAYVSIIPEGSRILPTLNKQMAGAGSAAGKNAGESINKGILGSLGSLAGPIAATIAGLGIGRLLSDSINNASDFQEAGTAVTAVFGDADKTIQAFAANAASTLGQSTNMTLDAARTFGTFGKAAGLSGEDLAGFSTEFITLAADLASFNNTTPEQAIEALGAGLRGESEPLRQYGVLLDDAALKARATELGIYSGTGALTQQQKVLASQAEIMAQTSTQQGDFAKTSGGLANQQRILSAGLQNLSSSFGRLLLPAMLKVVGFLNRTVVPALDKASVVVGDFFAKATPAAKGLYDLLSKGDFTAGLREATGLTEDSPLIDFLLTARDKAIDAGQAIKDNFGPVFTTLGDAIGPLVPKLLELYTTFSPFSVLLTALTPVIPQIASVLTALGESLGIVLNALVESLPILTPVLGELAVALGGALAEALTEIGPVLPLIAESFAELIVSLVPLIPKILELVPALLELVPAITELVTTLLPPLIDFLGVILPVAIDILSRALDFLVPLLVDVVNNATLLIQALSTVVDFLSGDIDASTFIATILGAGGVVGSIGEVAKVVGEKFYAFVNGITTGATQLGASIGEGVAKAIEFLTSLPERAIGAVSDLGSTLFESGKSLIQGFIDGINDTLGGVGDAVGGVMDFVGDFFPNSPAKRGQFSGSGWTKLLHSGEAIGSQFGRGLSASTSGLGIGNVAIPNVASTVAGVAAGTGTAAVGGGRAITVNNYGGPRQSPEVFGRVIVDGLNFQEKLAGAV